MSVFEKFNSMRYPVKIFCVAQALNFEKISIKKSIDYWFCHFENKVLKSHSERKIRVKFQNYITSETLSWKFCRMSLRAIEYKLKYKLFFKESLLQKVKPRKCGALNARNISV